MSNIERYDYAFDPNGDAWPARVLRRMPPGGRVLELGPGPGAMTRVLVARGYEVTVVENDPEALQVLGPLGVKAIAADLNGLDWLKALNGQRFNAILACDVLEHLNQPEQVLQAMGELVEPMGSLLVSLPNIAYAGVVAALRNGMFDYAEKGLLDRTHMRFFTRRSIEKTLMESGWIPRKWDANRVPLVHSEFAWCWDALAEPLRQYMLAGWNDFDVYQWMVVATPSRDAQAWGLADVRTEMERLRAELQALRLVHEPEHASLLEHQKAFAEAKDTINQFQLEASQLRQQIECLSGEKSDLEAALHSAREAHKALAERSLRGRLRRLLRPR